MFTSIKLFDENRNITIEFQYHDEVKHYQQYAHSKYYYDYKNDLLMIVHGDNIIYQEFEYGREK
jgi:hypothetical protein